MSVQYRIVERGNPGNRGAPKKFHPSIQSSGRMTLRQVTHAVSQASTVSEADTFAVLEALFTLIPQQLSYGNIVELGDFGNFWLRTDTEGADAPEGVRPSAIRALFPRFNGGREFKNVLDTIEFVKVEQPESMAQ